MLLDKERSFIRIKAILEQIYMFKQAKKLLKINVFLEKSVEKYL